MLCNALSYATLKNAIVNHVIVVPCAPTLHLPPLSKPQLWHECDDEEG